jgi:hypothetical protein
MWAVTPLVLVTRLSHHSFAATRAISMFNSQGWMFCRRETVWESHKIRQSYLRSSLLNLIVSNSISLLEMLYKTTRCYLATRLSYAWTRAGPRHFCTPGRPLIWGSRASKIFGAPSDLRSILLTRGRNFSISWARLIPSTSSTFYCTCSFTRAIWKSPNPVRPANQLLTTKVLFFKGKFLLYGANKRLK